MNFNQEVKYNTVPQANISRSKFDMSFGLKTTFNTGSVVPIFLQEVLPGDTFNVKDNKVVRMQTPLNPFMDNIALDTYYFFVPNRLCWSHWREFMGENTESAWIPQTVYSMPQVEAPSGGWQKGTIADYMNIPIGKSNFKVSALPFRAYARVMDDWFKDQNLQNPVSLSTGDSDIVGSNGTNYISDLEKGGFPFVACKLPDMFTRCLPSPQKGPDVFIDITGGQFPVFGNGLGLGLTNGSKQSVLSTDGSNSNVLGVLGQNAIDTIGSPVGTSFINWGQSLGALNSLGVPTKTQLGEHPEYSGLIADVSNVSIMSINELRMAMQMQKFYEALARSGSRYIEIIKNLFGVDSPDARLQRTEYLGGNRCAIQVNQVLQSSETSTTSLGTTGAFSLTSHAGSGFVKSFTEHGYILGVCVARYHHTYQQGLEKHWFRKERFDFYFPQFANIGEQPILNKQLYLQGSSAVDSDGNPYDEQVFGYNEAWVEYRNNLNRTTGEMRSAYAQSLDIWHLGDDYNSMPYLGSSWIVEDKANVDRVLSVSSSNADQFFADMYFDVVATRPLPTFSVPGLMDHH